MRNLNKKDNLLKEIEKVDGKIELHWMDIINIISINIPINKTIEKIGKID